jgi:hypothetical protein
MFKQCLILASAAVVAVMAAPGAEAKERFKVEYLFDELAPHPESYFFDEDFEDGGIVVYEREPGRPEATGYGDFDDDFYEPKFEPRTRKRIKQAEPKLTDPPAVVKKKPVPKVAALPPAAKTEPKKKDLPKAAGVTCEKGARIVSGYGFSDVKPKSCDGKTYSFTGIRSGKNYEITLSPANGELTEVKRI